jgi:hypothetical protein
MSGNAIKIILLITVREERDIDPAQAYCQALCSFLYNIISISYNITFLTKPLKHPCGISNLPFSK